MNQRVLLVHSSDWLGVSRLPGLFHRAGATTTLFGLPGTVVSQSRYVAEFIAAPPDLDAFVAQLRTIVEETGDRYAWIMLLDDALVTAVARHADEAWLDRCFPVDRRSEALGWVSSKFALLAACRAAGIPVPESRIVNGIAEALAVAEQIGYPVMVKCDTGAGGSGVRKAHTAAELRTAIEAFGDTPLNIEEFVEGIVGIVEVLYNHGIPSCWVSFEKRRQFPAFGGSSLRRAFEPPELAPMMRACGALTHFNGFVSLCWQYDPRINRLVLLEMNPRPSSAMHLRPEPECIFAGGIRARLAGSPYAFEPPRPDRLYRLFPQDLQRAFMQRDIAGIAWWWPGLPSARDIPWNDPALLWAEIRVSLAAFVTGARERYQRRRSRANSSMNADAETGRARSR